MKITNIYLIRVDVGGIGLEVDIQTMDGYPSAYYVGDLYGDEWTIGMDNANRDYAYNDYDDPIGIGVRPVIYISY